ncbi:hypothetical protein NUACC21_70840 [Scytonema sp. NUACC21]
MPLKVFRLKVSFCLIAHLTHYVQMVKTMMNQWMLPPNVLSDVESSYNSREDRFNYFWQVAIKLNDACTLRCTYCNQYAEFDKSVSLPLEEVLHLISSLHKNQMTKSVLLTGGEPLIYNGLDKVLLSLNESNIPFDINTGLFVGLDTLKFLIESEPRTIRYSIHSHREEEHNAFTQKKSGNKVFANARFLSTVSNRK